MIAVTNNHTRKCWYKLKKRIILQLKKIDRSLRRWNRTLNWNKQVNRIYKSTSAVLDLNHPSITEAKKYWRKYNLRLNPKRNAFCAALNNIHSSRYIPEDIFLNYIMPSLNNFILAQAYNDKNMYDVFMQGITMPKTVLRCMHGNLHDANYNLLNIGNYSKSLTDKEVDYFIKPTIDSGSGKNIKKCKIRGGKIFVDDVLQDINKLKSSYKGEFIIQESIDQSLILSDMYPYSVNCIRSMSLRYEDKIIVLSNLMKFGNNRNYVDNTGAEGVVCGVDKNGNITEFGYDHKFNKVFEHPFTRKPFKNIALPNFGKLEKIIVQGHERLPHFDLVAWDFGVDKVNKYVLIEYNLLFPGLDYHQVFNGPIFENYLDRILNNVHETEYI
jgi:hypothetical protein